MSDSALQVNSGANQALLTLAKANCDALHEGLTVLNGVSPDQFIQDLNPTFQATIGAHFRHLIEHYQCFLNQFDERLFNYDCRPRQSQLESDLPCAIAALEVLIGELESLPMANSCKECRLVDAQSDSDLFSSVGRELLFLQAHTVHHYAIIAAMMRYIGVAVPNDFGIAISTQQHLAGVANLSPTQS